MFQSGVGTQVMMFLHTHTYLDNVHRNDESQDDVEHLGNVSTRTFETTLELSRSSVRILKILKNQFLKIPIHLRQEHDVGLWWVIVVDHKSLGRASREIKDPP